MCEALASGNFFCEPAPPPAASSVLKAVARAGFMLAMTRLGLYLVNLNTGRLVLWCYAIWYLVNVLWYFDARPRLWLTSIGLSGIIGVALLISTRNSSKGTMRLDRWQTFRLFLMPFCVSSFAALVKDAGYLLIFPPSWRLNLLGFAAIALFVAVVALLKSTRLRRP